MSRVTFRPYRRDDCRDCLDIFDANCPTAFSPNERCDYEEFLAAAPAGYEVCEVDGNLFGAFGVFDCGDGDRVIRWILFSPTVQGMGIGTRVMQRIIRQCQGSNAVSIRIATSPQAAAFFARFGAVATATTADGWGPGMDRVDMELQVPQSSRGPGNSTPGR